jgi:hypothetical protein
LLFPKTNTDTKRKQTIVGDTGAAVEESSCSEEYGDAVLDMTINSRLVKSTSRPFFEEFK